MEINEATASRENVNIGILYTRDALRADSVSLKMVGFPFVLFFSSSYSQMVMNKLIEPGLNAVLSKKGYLFPLLLSLSSTKTAQSESIICS